MFGLFKKKSQTEKLEEKLAKLRQEAFELSKVDRKRSDAKQAEAAAVERELEQLEGK